MIDALAVAGTPPSAGARWRAGPRPGSTRRWPCCRRARRCAEQIDAAGSRPGRPPGPSDRGRGECAHEVRRPHPDVHRGHDVPGALREAGGHPAHGPAGRAGRFRLRVGQRPHDHPALRAARVARAPELLRAADHLHLRGGAHRAHQAGHRHHRAAHAHHAGAGQAGGHARPALGRARDPRRRHRRLPRGVRGALPRRPRRPAGRHHRRGDAGAAPALHRAQGELPGAPRPLRGGRVLPQAAADAAADVRGRQPRRGAPARRRVRRGLDAGGALARGDRPRRGGRPPGGRQGRARRRRASTSRRSSRAPSGARTTRRCSASTPRSSTSTWSR